MTKPNFFIIGAAKAGTTSLHAYLSAHPQIYLCEPKEPNFFVEEGTWERGFAWYESLFKEAKTQRIIGEASVTYTWLPKYRGVAEKIWQYAPNARLVYILRDPIDRAISHYRYDVSLGLEHETIKTALTDTGQYLSCSKYHMQLQPFARLFGMDSIYLMTLEALNSDPHTELKKLYRWLDLAPPPPSPTDDEAYNVTPPSAPRSMFIERFRRSALYNNVLAPILPTRLRDAARRLSRANKPFGKSDRDFAVDWLKPRLKDDIDALCRQFDRSFPEWKTYYN